MTQIQPQAYRATAFLSCSLRPEDKPFVDFIERILIVNGVKPIGTVGRYAASPQNPAELMRTNIQVADFTVIVATPRYVQKDLGSGRHSYGVSEMVHIETGIAYAYGKPVVVFVQEGTQVGNFLPGITQYITLSGRRDDLRLKAPLITSLLTNTVKIVKNILENKNTTAFGSLLKGGLALYGGLQLVSALFGEEPPSRTRTRTKSKRK